MTYLDHTLAADPAGSRLLRPGLRLMRTLRMPAKMGLLGAMLVVPLFLLLALAMLHALADIGVARSEREGAVLARQVTELALLVQSHRSLSNQVAAGNLAATAARDALRARLRQSVQRTDEILAQTTRFSLEDLWPAERTRLLALVDGQQAERRAEAVAAHGVQAERLHRLLKLIGERSQLLFDPRADTFFLMDLGVERMLPWLDAIGRLDVQGGELLQRDASVRERTLMLGLADDAQRTAESVVLQLQALSRAGVEVSENLRPASEATGRLMSMTRASFDAEVISGESAAHHAAGQEALQALARFGDELWVQLDLRLGERIEALQQRLWLQGVAVVVGLLGVFYLGLSFYASFMWSLRQVMGSLVAVAQGDLSRPVRIEGRDELGAVGAELERMSARLSALVGEIRSSAVGVDQAGVAVAGDGQALSERTDTQASSLRRTLLTVELLSQAVGNNTVAADALQTLTTRLREDAALGSTAMHDSIQAMHTLEQSVNRVAEVNAVIDDIAFQTNLLAINASIEAARAGHAGKGFSVVAGEIRQLANRCGEAAGEVRVLIESTTEQTGHSRRSIEDAGDRLTSVMGGVDDISARLVGITVASQAQNRALEQVSSSVHDLDVITRQNVDMVEQTSVAAESLATQAASLRTSVASIRLRPVLQPAPTTSI
jgi:methyl-accepting chemotaxis protein